MEAKNHPKRNDPKSFNAQLAMDNPAYTMVICKHWQLKTVVAVCRKFAIFDRKGQIDGYFQQLR